MALSGKPVRASAEVTNLPITCLQPAALARPGVPASDGVMQPAIGGAALLSYASR